MSFTNMTGVTHSGGGISAKGNTFPTAVVFLDVLYVFYQPADSESVHFTRYNGTGAWSNPENIQKTQPAPNIAPSTSPCVVVYKKLLYLFYNSTGDAGTFLITFDGTKWNPGLPFSGLVKAPVHFQPSTRASAAVFQDTLHLFWTGSDNSVMSTTSNGSDWTAPFNVSAKVGGGIAIANSTSPAAVTYNNILYLFYNGAGNNGTFYTKLSANGDWSPGPFSVGEKVAGMGFLPRTSPSAFRLTGSETLCLLWTSSHADGAYYSLLTGDTWEGGAQTFLNISIRGQVLDTASPCGVAYRQIPYVFWRSHYGGTLYMYSGQRFKTTDADWSAVKQYVTTKQRFTIQVDDQKALDFVKSLQRTAKAQHGRILANEFASAVTLPKSEGESNKATKGLIEVISSISKTSSFTCWIPAGEIGANVAIYFTSGRLPGNENRIISLVN